MKQGIVAVVDVCKRRVFLQLLMCVLLNDESGHCCSYWCVQKEGVFAVGVWSAKLWMTALLQLLMSAKWWMRVLLQLLMCVLLSAVVDVLSAKWWIRVLLHVLMCVLFNDEWEDCCSCWCVVCKTLTSMTGSSTLPTRESTTPTTPSSSTSGR